MKRVLKYIRRKLSVRVSLWIVIFAAAIFIAALSFLFYQAREAVRQEAISRATQILDKTSLPDKRYLFDDGCAVRVHRRQRTGDRFLSDAGYARRIPLCGVKRDGDKDGNRIRYNAVAFRWDSVDA